MEEPIFVSEVTYRRLHSELDHIKNVEFARNRDEMRTALELGGGMHDNAPYEHGAYDEQIILRRISVLERILERVRIIDFGLVDESVAGFGTEVTVRDADEGSTTVYAIVGAYDEHGDGNRVSYLSPIGQGLMGRRVGETVSIDLPRGRVRLKVNAIRKMQNLDD